MSFFGGSADQDNGIRPDEGGPHKAIVTVNIKVQPVMNDGSLSGIVVHDQDEIYLVSASSKKKCLEKLVEMLKAINEKGD